MIVSPSALRALLGLSASLCFAISAEAEVPLLIFAGQSNMVGYRTDVNALSEAERQQQPGVFFFGPNDEGGNWAPIELGKGPTQIDQTASGRGFGPEVTVGQALIDAGRFSRVGEVKYVFNGGANRSFLAAPADAAAGHYSAGILSSWMPQLREPGVQSLYEELLARVRAAQDSYRKTFGEKTYIAGFFWMQGESDAQNENTAKLYGRNLRRFIVALRRDLNAPNMPFIYGRIRDTDIFPEDAAVRAGQDAVANPADSLYLPMVACVDTDEFEMFSAVDPKAGDGPGHYSSKGTWQLGKAMGQAYLTLTSTQHP